MTDRPWTLQDGANRKRDMMALATELFPIHRTLVNQGYSDSLDIIRRELDIEVLRVPSGTAVWDWIVPNAWDVNEAYIENLQGHRLVDFADSNLHLSAYSVPFEGMVSRAELLEHVRTAPDRPDAIPYNFLYYRRDWEFNVAHDDLAKFTDDAYRVHIDVSERPGALEIGCCHLPGTSKRELLVSTYLCHPSLANDNLSGVVVAVALFRLLAAMPERRYTYRLVIVPETIGAISYLSQFEDRLADVLGAYVVNSCGNRAGITYKRSYFGDARVDRVATHVLRHYTEGASVRDWRPFGSDERQFNAPGVRIPAGGFTRSPTTEFPEYHTSKDTLDVLSDDALLDSLQTLYRFVQVLERDVTYANAYRGEPCFARHEIEYPRYHEDKDDQRKYIVKKLVHEFDGSQSLLEIADKWDIPMDQAAFVADQFCAAGLVRPVDDDGDGR